MFDNTNIVDVRFTNAANDTISVVYRDNDTNENVETYVQVNEDDATYKALVAAGYSQEVMIERTIEAKKAHMRNVYNVFREQHQGEYLRVIDDLEREKQEKLEEVREQISRVSETLNKKRQQFLIAVAAIEALKKDNRIKDIL
jgi:hypothetical protein